MGAYCFVTSASGRLKIIPTKPPFTQPGMGNSMLKIINPIANLLMNEATIALGLSLNVINIIGMTETTPKIRPAMTPFKMFVTMLFF